MAKAIKNVVKLELTEEEKRAQDLREIETALLDNKDAILETIDLLKQMNNRGVLTMATSLFAEGDKVLHTIIKALDNPEATNLLKNMLLLVGVLGTINVKQLEPFVVKLNAGVARMSENKEQDKPISYLGFAKTLKDPEVNRAVGLLLDFLRGMGQDTEDLERNTQPPEEQAVQKERTRDYEGTMHKRD